MNIFNAVIFGIVEGITEFLPVSSTGHLILTARILKLASTEFMKSFEIAIQLGAICSVVVLYWRRLLLDWAVIKRILAAFLPTAVIGAILYKFIKQYLLGNSVVVIWSLFLGGVFLIIFELAHREKNGAGGDNLSDISYKQAFLVGIFQALAVVPGVSRSAATIIGGLILGLKRRTIVEFSFLLAVPTMFAATALDLVKSSAVFNAGQITFLAVGFLISFLVALLSIRFLLHFIKTHTFIPFGIYRMIVALLFLRLI
jgi:undecaprenyl-diphosphatase